MKEWERARFIALQVVNMAGKQSKREIKPWELFRLPTDKIGERKIATFKKLSDDELKEVYRKNGLTYDNGRVERI